MTGFVDPFVRRLENAELWAKRYARWAKDKPQIREWALEKQAEQEHVARVIRADLEAERDR